jgi:ring-1,2-phenylacetyl-CoA epoxidase subunit PaaD
VTGSMRDEAVGTRQDVAPAVRAAVEAVPDPELPVLTIAELGILRDVRAEAGRVIVTITPTYSGCPAMDAIRADVLAACAAAGAPDAEVRTVLSPAWTTDWLTAEGARKLAEYGVAPPAPRAAGAVVPLPLAVRRQGGPLAGSAPRCQGGPLAGSVPRCPQCGSPDTVLTSRFSSTACKALHTCRSCREPFEGMKAI